MRWEFSKVKFFITKVRSNDCNSIFKVWGLNEMLYFSFGMKCTGVDHWIDTVWLTRDWLLGKNYGYWKFEGSQKIKVFCSQDDAGELCSVTQDLTPHFL